MTDNHDHQADVAASPPAGTSEVPIRDVHLDTAFDTVPKYFAGGNVALSHLFAMLSATFPDGEEYFVRSLSAVQHRITDDELARDVAGFIGQESMHGREHRAFNERLASLGYPTKQAERYTDRGYRLFERISSPRLHLAVTAGVEHYTATLAELLLGDHRTREVFEHDATQRLFVWHALEESEHKAVAFDTFQHVGGGELMRRLAMTAVHVDFISHTIAMTAVSVALDPDARRHPLRTLRDMIGLIRSPFASLSAATQLAQYYRRGFHPNDRDTTELVTTWRSELFA
ncbi:metal-dependent hydrolase [Ilumatobacter nonamiensis]|uniref:metal-dependent hydrolase n=1 Tax=Ilumatobacter nonamiensis TaxID=467093 RepID=UPI0003468170|nr:metal-dependent hydrolase [Ilumatobacter nonamiensis]